MRDQALFGVGPVVGNLCRQIERCHHSFSLGAQPVNRAVPSQRDEPCNRTRARRIERPCFLPDIDKCVLQHVLGVITIGKDTQGNPV